MRLLAAVMVVTPLVLGGCADPSAPRDAHAGEHAPTESTSPTDAAVDGSMTVTPAAAEPGQRVAVRFQPEKMRGIAYSLSTSDQGGWRLAYYLTSDWGASAGHRPTWWRVEDAEGRGWEDVGITGPGPDRVVIPDDAPPGETLLCTANSVRETCAVLTVIDPTESR